MRLGLNAIGRHGLVGGAYDHRQTRLHLHVRSTGQRVEAMLEAPNGPAQRIQLHLPAFVVFEFQQ
eukprot:9249114-Alexandrium_andersonii.AAC.1